MLLHTAGQGENVHTVPYSGFFRWGKGSEADYKKRLTKLNLLPLMYMLDLRDVMFCVKSLKEPTADFDIRTHSVISK